MLDKYLGIYCQGKTQPSIVSLKVLRMIGTLLVSCVQVTRIIETRLVNDLPKTGINTSVSTKKYEDFDERIY